MIKITALCVSLMTACLSSSQRAPVTPAASVPYMVDVDALSAPDALARIAAIQPVVTVKYQGRTVKAVGAAAPPFAADVARLALIGFVRCDDSYKLFVTPDLRQGIERGESFIRLDFSKAITAKSTSATASTSVRSMLVPLTGRWAQSGQTFFYEDADGSWSALRWSTPDPAIRQALLAAAAKMVH